MQVRRGVDAGWVLMLAWSGCGLGVPAVPEVDQVSAALQRAAEVVEAEDPAQAYQTLSDDEREELDSVMLPATTEVTSALVSDTGQTMDSAALSAASGCFSQHATGEAKALAGNTLYTYWQTTRICAANGLVTAVAAIDAGGETSTPGWRIDAPPTRTELNADWEGRGNAEYHFVLGAQGIDIQHPTTCLQVRLNADLVHYAIRGSCDLYEQ